MFQLGEVFLIGCEKTSKTFGRLGGRALAAERLFAIEHSKILILSVNFFENCDYFMQVRNNKKLSEYLWHTILFMNENILFFIK